MRDNCGTSPTSALHYFPSLLRWEQELVFPVKMQIFSECIENSCVLVCACVHVFVCVHALEGENGDVCCLPIPQP